MNKFKRLRYRFIFKVNFQKGEDEVFPFFGTSIPIIRKESGLPYLLFRLLSWGHIFPPLGTDRNPSNSGGLYKQKQRLLPFRNSLRHTICADQSCSGAISLYPFPWILMISIDGSSFKCLRNLVIYTSILLALK